MTENNNKMTASFDGSKNKVITFAPIPEEIITPELKHEEEHENGNINIQTVTGRDSLQQTDVASVRNESNNNTNYLPAVDSKMLKQNSSLLRNTSEQYSKRLL